MYSCLSLLWISLHELIRSLLRLRTSPSIAFLFQHVRRPSAGLLFGPRTLYCTWISLLRLLQWR